MTTTGSIAVDGAPRPVHTLLQSHGRERGDEPALVGVRDGVVVDVTWRELELRVERAAAGLLRAAFRPHHAAIILMRPSINAVEVELALRSVGAVAIHVAPDVHGDELAALLAGVRVRLVISDDASSAARLAGYPLATVEQLALGTGTDWERVQAIGAAYLEEHPACVADAAADRVDTGAVHVLREADRVVARRLPVLGADPGAAASVLLDGPAWDPRVASVRALQLASGGALAWTDDADRLPALLQHASPDVLVSLSDGDRVADLLRRAQVEGHSWHRAPDEPLSAALALAAGERVGLGVRRRARAVDSLRPWFGPRLRTVVLDRRHSPVLAAVAHVLDLEVLAPHAPTLEPVTLPRVPSRPPPPIKPLPHRRPSDPDEAFRPAGPIETSDELDEDDTVLPSLSLMLGESVLDRVLADQRRAAQQAPA